MAFSGSERSTSVELSDLWGSRALVVPLVRGLGNTGPTDVWAALHWLVVVHFFFTGLALLVARRQLARARVKSAADIGRWSLLRICGTDRFFGGLCGMINDGFFPN